MNPVLGLALVAALLFFIAILSTVMGAAVGWVVGLFFADTIIGFLGRIGVNVDGLSMWQVGAALGFIGSFFKSTLQQKDK